MADNEQEKNDIAKQFESLMRNSIPAKDQKNDDDEVEIRIIKGSLKKAFEQLENQVPKEVYKAMMDDIEKATDIIKGITKKAQVESQIVNKAIGSIVTEMIKSIPDEVCEGILDCSGPKKLKPELFAIFMAIITFLSMNGYIKLTNKKQNEEE